MMFFQGLLGDVQRAQNMAIALDECGNALFGGEPEMTISTRTGNGVILGYKWAIRLAPIIDWFFGAGHCAENANITVK